MASDRAKQLADKLSHCAWIIDTHDDVPAIAWNETEAEDLIQAAIDAAVAEAVAYHEQKRQEWMDILASRGATGDGMRRRIESLAEILNLTKELEQ